VRSRSDLVGGFIVLRWSRRKGGAMKKNEFHGALYFAVGAFTRNQRLKRDRKRLQAPARGGPPAGGLPDVILVRSVVRRMCSLNEFLDVGVRPVGHRDDEVSLEIECFKPGWPGNTASGTARDPRRAFARWLDSAEGRALFEDAGGVTLFAIDLNVTPSSD
jgi:hypothetical protein